MKKIIAVISLLAIMFSVSSCGEKKETVEEHNKKLVSGEIDPDVEKTKKSNDDKDNKSDEQSDEQSEKKQDENIEIADSSGVSINIPEEELASLVDKSDDEYESFEVVDMPSANFFMGKKLTAIAALSQHEMTILSNNAVSMTVNNENIKFNYTTEEGAQEKSAFIYKISPQTLKTNSGREYTYIVYGTEPITEGEINGTVGILRIIKLKDGVDIGENKEDTYVLYEETAQSGSYYIMKME